MQPVSLLITRVRWKGRAEAAFWRSAVWLPAEAARVAGIGPYPSDRDGDGGTAFSRGDACGGTPKKRASALLAVASGTVQGIANSRAGSEPV